MILKHYLDIARAVNSITKCGIPNSKIQDFTYKVLTLFNLLLKVLPLSNRLIPWLFREPSILLCRFQALIMKFLLYPRTDSVVFTNPWFHEYDIQVFITKVLERGDVFIDIGAHVGLYTVLAGIKVGSSGLVVAVEPNPINALILRFNVKLNKLSNVHIVQKALGDKEGSIELYFEPNRTAFSTLLQKPRNRKHIVMVQMTTLDKIAETYGIHKIKVIKIDTEGYDFYVLKGGVKTIQKTYYLIVEENTRRVRKFLSNMGFSIRTLYPSGYLLACLLYTSPSPRDLSTSRMPSSA